MSSTTPLVALTWAAALIHALVVPEHLQEWGPAGAFFAVTAAAQIGWAVLIWRRPSRALLRVGLFGNAALVLLWLTSRTVGIPVGPHAGEIEALGAFDALAALNELLAGGMIMALLAGRGVTSRIATGTASAVVAATLLVPFTGQSHHGAGSHRAAGSHPTSGSHQPPGSHHSSRSSSPHSRLEHSHGTHPHIGR